MDTLSDQSSFSRETREHEDSARAAGNAVLWIAVIAVLIGLNFASWSFCMWVFGQPEHPMNYKLLTRLDKLDPIRGFTPVTAPRGKFHSAKDLYAKVYPLSRAEMRAYNGILKRHYLKNYFERDDVVFLSGEFTVLSVQRMGEDDVFPSGLVIRAKSTSFPDAQIDLALPAERVPATFALEIGQVLKVEESSTCAALLNIDRRDDATMVFTAAPLVERVYTFAENAEIELKVPEEIRIDPEFWPIGGDDEEMIVAKPVRLAPVEEEEDVEGDR